MAIVILSKIEASNLSLKDYLSMSSETPVELIYPTGEYREESLFFPPFQTNQKMPDESLPRVEKAIHSQGQNDYEKLKLGFEDLKTTCKILAANLHASDKKLEAVTIENMVRAVRLEELQRDNKQLQDERVKLEELVRDNRQLQDEPELLKTLKRENQQLRDDLRNSNTLDGENQRLRKERITLLNAVSLLKASVSLLKASNLTARTEGELALIKEKQTLQDEVVSLRDAPNCANHCCVTFDSSKLAAIAFTICAAYRRAFDSSNTRSIAIAICAAYWHTFGSSKLAAYRYTFDSSDTLSIAFSKQLSFHYS